MKHYNQVKSIARSRFESTHRELFLRPFQNSKFLTWPGSIANHHAFRGGLAEHTGEVVILCDLEATNSKLPELKTQELLIAAAWHDWGKIFQYEYTGDLASYIELPQVPTSNMNKFVKSPLYDMLYHIYMSARDFSKYYENYRRDLAVPFRSDEIEHAILAHHGKLEWKSPVTPKTSIAHILHKCDSESAYGDFEKRVIALTVH